jgi:hypothetical protein
VKALPILQAVCDSIKMSPIDGVMAIVAVVGPLRDYEKVRAESLRWLSVL